jgi:hypothetical protein
MRWSRNIVPYLLALLLASPAVCIADQPVALPPMPARPAQDAEPTPISYVLWLGDVMNINSVAQTFSANMILVLRWRDPRLAHGESGVKQYQLEDVWHPRLLVVNETGEVVRSLPEVVTSTLDGDVTYRQRFVGSFTQALDLRDFPFDHGKFRIRFVALGHRPSDIRLIPEPQAVAAGLTHGAGIAGDLTVQDWRITAVDARADPYTVSPGLEIAGFSIELTAQRKSQHFVIKVILPLILIVMMSWAVFWIEPSDTGTQVGLAVTAMLTLIAYRFAVDSDVPKLPYLTRLDTFILFSTLLVFLSLLEVMVTTKLAGRDRIVLARTIDRCCRWIVPPVFASIGALIFLG